MCNQVANLSLCLSHSPPLSLSATLSLLNPFAVVIIMAKKSLPAVTALLSTSPPPPIPLANSAATVEQPACSTLLLLLPNMHTLCECLNELFLLLPHF